MNSFDSWQTSLQRNRLKQNSTIEFNIKLTPCQNTFFDRILNESVSLQVNEVVKQAGAWKEYGRLNIYWTENESINNLAAITRVATPSKSNSVTAGFEQLPVASDHPSLSTTVMLHMHLHAWTIFTNESAVTLAGAGKQFMQKKQNSKNLLRYYARHLHTSLLWSWMHAIAWKSFWQERSFLATKMPALEAYCSDMCSDNVAVVLGDQRLRTTSGRDWLPSLSTTVLFHTHLHAWTTLAYEVALRLVDAGNQFWIKKCDFALVLCARRCLETRLKKINTCINEYARIGRLLQRHV